MKKLALALTALAVIAVFSSPVEAGHQRRGSYHRELQHRSYHRSLTHRDAHRYPISYRQHDRLHDDLRHDAYHDRLEHRSNHRYDRGRRIGIGFSGRGFSFWLGH